MSKWPFEMIKLIINLQSIFNPFVSNTLLEPNKTIVKFAKPYYVKCVSICPTDSILYLAISYRHNIVNLAHLENV